MSRQIPGLPSYLFSIAWLVLALKECFSLSFFLLVFTGIFWSLKPRDAELGLDSSGAEEFDPSKPTTTHRLRGRGEPSVDIVVFVVFSSSRPVNWFVSVSSISSAAAVILCLSLLHRPAFVWAMSFSTILGALASRTGQRLAAGEHIPTPGDVDVAASQPPVLPATAMSSVRPTAR